LPYEKKGKAFMPSADKPRFTVVGSGLAGALFACYLGRAGYAVDVYEKRVDPRGHDPERGRSINLALSVRGIHALRELGLADEVLRHAIPMRGRMMHSTTGEITFQPYGKDDSECINSVSRAGLNLTLVNAAARYPSVRFFFEHRCTGIDLPGATIEVLQQPGNTIYRIPCELVIGADGVYSAVRAEMQKHERFNYEQDYLSHGYKELTIPPGPGGTHQMEKHALHIWPRHSFMMIALPNEDGSFTCTLFYPYDGPNSFAALKSDDDIRWFFQQRFPDAVPLMPALVEDFHKNPVGPLVTIRCSPWHADGKVVLIGDAAHAVVPFLGQGMNAAFEDCTVLDQCLQRCAPDWDRAFRTFEEQRKENTDTLADLCIDNFLEMRDLVSSRAFLWRKRIQILLHKLFPRWYLPLYTLVTFTRTPYAEAVRRVRTQDRVVRTIFAGLIAVLVLIVFAILWRWWRP
jgi:kynurenine 3-monooxygenase